MHSPLRAATRARHLRFMATHHLAAAYSLLRAQIHDLATPETYIAVYGSPRPTSTLVLLHGTEGYAEAAVAIWATLVDPAKVRLIAIQWWDGATYLDDDQIVAAIGKARRLLGDAGPYLVEGYSRAGSRIPAIAARMLALPEASRPRGYLMESASADHSYPGTANLVTRAAERPLLGARIAVVGGADDSNPNATADRLRETQADLLAWGADAYLRLVPGEHGALTADPEAVAAVLAWMSA